MTTNAAAVATLAPSAPPHLALVLPLQKTINAFLFLTVGALLLGVLPVIAIGDGDMPVFEVAQPEHVIVIKRGWGLGSRAWKIHSPAYQDKDDFIDDVRRVLEEVAHEVTRVVV